MNKSDREKYYEETDFSELIRIKGKKTAAAAKRITLNISEQLYDEANELDTYMRMGYQNVLKTAMTIGLTELYNQVSRHTVGKTSTTLLSTHETDRALIQIRKQRRVQVNKSSLPVMPTRKKSQTL